LKMPEQVLLLLILLIQQVISQEGIGPIPASELYGESFNLTHEQAPECQTSVDFKSFDDHVKCWRATLYHKDYGCRYYPELRPMCYCCGAYYHYIEHGRVCTAFCLEEDSATDSRKYGLERIIIVLPFNWGSSSPDRITLEDGTELPVPCDDVNRDNYSCGGGDSEGKRNRRRGNSERRKVKDKLETIPASEKRRTTTLQPSVRMTTVPQTWRTTTQRRRTPRTTTTRSKTKLVQFSLTDFSTINESIVRPKTVQHIKKTTISVAFGERLRTSGTSSTEYQNVWSSKQKTPKVTEPTKILDDRPVW